MNTIIKQHYFTSSDLPFINSSHDGAFYKLYISTLNNRMAKLITYVSLDRYLLLGYQSFPQVTSSTFYLHGSEK